MNLKVGDRVTLIYPEWFKAGPDAVFIITKIERDPTYEGGAWARVRLESGNPGELDPHRALAITHFTPVPKE